MTQRGFERVVTRGLKPLFPSAKSLGKSPKHASFLTSFGLIQKYYEGVAERIILSCDFQTGPTKGGAVGGNDPGAHGLYGAHHGARWFQGAQQRAHRNDNEKSVCGRPKNSFFFLRSHENSDKTVAISPSVLEFTKP